MFINRNPHTYSHYPPPTALFNPPPDVRKKIQNYSFLLNDRIGKGYSSTVYRGMDDTTGEEVAIKVIELRSLRDQTSRIMLNTEIQCFKQVTHPNVLRYLNSYYTANNCYIITEYCPGGDLAKLIKQRGKLRQNEAKEMFLQLLGGYEAFHAAGYVHRDLKPANIFVAKDGSLRLADFGFSKKKTLVERQNYNVGTPIYMPRQSLAANIYNEKTDIWALGITLYQMLFGEVPFKGRTEHELRAEIERGMLNFPPDTFISNQLRDFISQCLLNDSFKRMGVKEMAKHPWLVDSKIVPKPIQHQESPERVMEEKDIRISLPHDGVLQNKSRQYFEGQDNRRSVSTMQKLKLCLPKKKSQIISTSRQPLTEISMNKENTVKTSICQNKENKPEIQNRTSVSTNSTKDGIRQLKKKKESSSPIGIEKVVSLINYFRLLFRILEKLSTAQAEVADPSVKTQLQKISKALTCRMNQIFKMHTLSLQDRSNQFSLDSREWIEFATSQRWQMYEYVIRRYSTKYTTILNESNDCSWEGASALFIDLWQCLNGGELQRILLIKQKYLCTEIMGLVNHLHNLDELIKREGWAWFSQKYLNGQDILIQSYCVGMSNYYEIESKLRQTYNGLKMSVFAQKY